MPDADFAAAQERLAARRQQQREREARARREEALYAARPTQQLQLARLPFPLDRLGRAGRSVWDAVRGREGTRPAFRVGQVDAELLDEELLELLKAQVGEGLKYFGTHLQDDYAPEILLVLRALLFKLTIWDHNASYGAALQGLRYTSSAVTKGTNPLCPPPPSRTQKTLYGLTTVLGRYAWTKWEDHLLSTSTSSPSPSLLNRLTTTLSTAHSLTALLSFLVFLTTGRHRTLTDRLLRLRLTPASSSAGAGATAREVSFEYLNRQLVWHAFTEFLLFLLPLVGIHRWRRLLGRAVRTLKSLLSSTAAFLLGRRANPSSDDSEDLTGSKHGALAFLPERTCALCYQEDQNAQAAAAAAGAGSAAAGGTGTGIIGNAATDVTNPYEALPCGCVYCYVCLAERLEAEAADEGGEGGGEGWECLRCGERVREARPWSGDVVVDVGGEEGGREGKEEEEEAEEEGLRRVDPAPVVEVGGMGGVGGVRGIGESEEWARADDGGSGEEEDDEGEEEEEEEGEDEQSEAYDEEMEDMDDVEAGDGEEGEFEYEM